MQHTIQGKGTYNKLTKCGPILEDVMVKISYILMQSHPSPNLSDL